MGLFFTPYGYNQTTILLLIIVFLFSMYAQFSVKNTFNKFSKFNNSRGFTASEVARKILDDNGLYDIQIVRVAGELTDHYDPKKKIIALSQSVHDSQSVAAIGVAAHEVGHAVQYAKNYVPIGIRMAILPAVQFGSYLWSIIFILGLVMSAPFLVDLGIILFTFIVIFQLITLPVEFNASSRAIKTLDANYILQDEELSGAKKVLKAAAMTYVAALAMSVVQLIRLLSARNSRN